MSQLGIVMFLRALIAFIALPGVIALILPPIIGSNDPWRYASRYQGIVVIVIGLILLISCVRDFYVSGKGTLAPWHPPKHLVIIGLYRYVRNPMYISVLILVAGWAIYFMSPIIFCYAIILAIAFHIRVVTNEEPWLEFEFGPEWSKYSSTVHRWFPGFNRARKNR